jgi:hypothetical protein
MNKITHIMPKRISKRGRINEGRPPLWTDSKAFEARSDEYFRYCDARLRTFVGKDGSVTTQVCPEPPTIAKWCLWMGWNDCHGHHEYADKPEYSAIIKRALTRIEGEVERSLLEGRNPVGCIFWLKNRPKAPWRDKIEAEVSSEVPSLGQILDRLNGKHPSQ